MGNKQVAVLVADQYIRYNGITFSRGMEIVAIRDKAAERFIRRGQAHWEYRMSGMGTYVSPSVAGTTDEGLEV